MWSAGSGPCCPRLVLRCSRDGRGAVYQSQNEYHERDGVQGCKGFAESEGHWARRDQGEDQGQVRLKE